MFPEALRKLIFENFIFERLTFLIYEYEFSFLMSMCKLEKKMDTHLRASDEKKIFEEIISPTLMSVSE